MGKPYAKEVERLQETYRAAIVEDGGLCARKFAPLFENPLIAIGSGGSLTAAHLAALLHVETTGHLARAMTPLETTSTSLRFDKMSLVFLTAGGSNADIIGSYRHLMRTEPSASLIICARQKSQLAKIAARHPHSGLVEFDLASGKDGFLATNSLLATSIILTKGYANVTRMDSSSTVLPETLEELLGWEVGFESGLSRLRSECASIWGRPTTVLLHGYWSQPAAIDFESKFTEASIGHLQIADYRHFAHGRHNWIGQRPTDCAVISLETPQDEHIAKETLSLIPAAVPRVRIQTGGNGARGALEAIVYSLCLTQLAGEARDIDPGRPDVSDFGRTLYHLNVYANGQSRRSTPANLRKIAIERKAGVSVDQLARLGTIDNWLQAYKAFVDRLGDGSLAGVVLDFDGTLIACDDRDSPIHEDLSAQLVRLLELGLTIGVATGRGDSVHAALRSALPKRLAKSVVIGFHNGAIISPLSEDAPSVAIDRPSTDLEGLFARLQAQEFLSLSARMRLGCGQITIFPLPGISREYVWDALRAAMSGCSSPGMNVWRSSHSIDITPATVSKRLVVSHLRKLSPALAVGGILCIGDMGKWPGNDYDLLREPLSLSVDEVSPDPETCWRLSPEGVRGVEATLWYLNRIEMREGKVIYNHP
jgi:hypothetical protein